MHWLDTESQAQRAQACVNKRVNSRHHRKMMLKKPLPRAVEILSTRDGKPILVKTDKGEGVKDLKHKTPSLRLTRRDRCPKG